MPCEPTLTCQAKDKGNKADWNKHAAELCIQYPIIVDAHMCTHLDSSPPLAAGDTFQDAPVDA